jgi:hypothetical protein
MITKNGEIKELLVGNRAYFAPNGSNIGTVTLPVLTSVLVKPGTPVIWQDFDLGEVQKMNLEVKYKERKIDGYKPGAGYRERENKKVTSRTVNLTLIDFVVELHHEILYGTGEKLVAGTPSPIFAENSGSRDGWFQVRQWDESETKLFYMEFYGRLSIKTNPDASSAPGVPVLDIYHLAEADPALETLTYKPV